MTASSPPLLFMARHDAECMERTWRALELMHQAPQCSICRPAVVLPLRPSMARIAGRPPRASVATIGGICDEHCRWVTGYQGLSRRHSEQELEEYHYDVMSAVRLGCVGSYLPEPSAELVHRNESVIYIGDLHLHFGHTLTDSMARMWYVVRHPEARHRVVMLCNPFWKWGREGVDPRHSYHMRLLELLGISSERLMIVTRPTRFNEVAVPEQAVYWNDGVCSAAELRAVYDAIAERITPVPCAGAGLYLSRRAWRTQADGEGYFEDYFASRGFEVICPERLPLEEQLARVAGAEVLACTMGTLSHLSLFARAGTRVIHLWRKQNQYNIRQLLIDELRQLQSVYVDTAAEGSNNVHQAMTPGRHWRDFTGSGLLP